MLWALVSMFGSVTRTASGWTDEATAIMLRGVEAMEEAQAQDVKSQIEAFKELPYFADERDQAALNRLLESLGGE